jgi:hypothetical protein
MIFFQRFAKSFGKFAVSFLQVIAGLQAFAGIALFYGVRYHAPRRSFSFKNISNVRSTFDPDVVRSGLASPSGAPAALHPRFAP